MAPPRFYAPHLDPDAPTVVLSPDESHHLVRVMRVEVEDEVAIFDGQGRAVRGTVERPDAKGVVVRIVAALAAEVEPRIPISLVQAVLKGDKMDGAIRDATMAGATRVAPIVAERSLVSLTALTRGRLVERWQRVAIASAKQCGRAWLPVIEAPSSFQDWLGRTDAGLRLLLSEPDSAGPSTPPLRGLIERAAPHAISCIVGPEGGWSASERRTAVDAGCVPVTFGATTLRADAAGLIAVSIVRFVLDERN